MKISYPILLDGGLSNVLEDMGCNLNQELWTAKIIAQNPDAIISAHLAYLEAGAQCITSSSYQASTLAFKKVGYEFKEAKALIIKSIGLAEKAISQYIAKYPNSEQPLLAASIGPYGAFLADGSEYTGKYAVSRQELYNFHQERIQILEETVADLYACETIPSLEEVSVLSEILNDTSKQAWISFSCKNENQLNDGNKITSAVNLLSDHQSVLAIGVNCTAPKYISGIIRKIKSNCKGKKIVIYPNSGEVYNAKTKTWNGLSDPHVFSEMVEEWLGLGANIVGGCCRVGPSHIKEIRKYFQTQ